MVSGKKNKGKKEKGMKIKGKGGKGKKNGKGMKNVAKRGVTN